MGAAVCTQVGWVCKTGAERLLRAPFSTADPARDEDHEWRWWCTERRARGAAAKSEPQVSSLGD